MIEIGNIMFPRSSYKTPFQLVLLVAGLSAGLAAVDLDELQHHRLGKQNFGRTRREADWGGVPIRFKQYYDANWKRDKPKEIETIQTHMRKAMNDMSETVLIKKRPNGIKLDVAYVSQLLNESSTGDANKEYISILEKKEGKLDDTDIFVLTLNPPEMCKTGAVASAAGVKYYGDKQDEGITLLLVFICQAAVVTYNVLVHEMMHGLGFNSNDVIDLKNPVKRTRLCGADGKTCEENMYVTPLAVMPHTREAMTDYFGCALSSRDFFKWENNGPIGGTRGKHFESEMFANDMMYSAVAAQRLSPITFAVLEDVPLKLSRPDFWYKLNRKTALYQSSIHDEWFGKNAGCSFVRDGCFQYMQNEIAIHKSTRYAEAFPYCTSADIYNFYMHGATVPMCDHKGTPLTPKVEMECQIDLNEDKDGPTDEEKTEKFSWQPDLANLPPKAKAAFDKKVKEKKTGWTLVQAFFFRMASRCPRFVVKNGDYRALIPDGVVPCPCGGQGQTKCPSPLPTVDSDGSDTPDKPGSTQKPKTTKKPGTTKEPGHSINDHATSHIPH